MCCLSASSLLVHELHHCLRWRGPGTGQTLLFEALISEGLADHFAMELLGAKHPWSNAFPRDETAKFLALAQPEFDSTTYNHPRWFFGGDHTLPWWTGYTLGFRLWKPIKSNTQAKRPSPSCICLHVSFANRKFKRPFGAATPAARPPAPPAGGPTPSIALPACPARCGSPASAPQRQAQRGLDRRRGMGEGRA